MPTLAVTTSAVNGIGMGLTTTAVLAASNLLISLLRKFIPDGVRMPAFIVVVASFVTIVQMLLEGFLPGLYASLGLYIPLIVVNCIILGRAEAYASKNPPIPSLFDGIGMGLGFTLSITCIGAVRELIGAGQLFGQQILPLADAAAGKWDMNRLRSLFWRREHFLFWLFWQLFRTNSRSARQSAGLIRVIRTSAAEPVLPAEIPCAKEVNINERINAYHCRICTCK